MPVEIQRHVDTSLLSPRLVQLSYLSPKYKQTGKLIKMSIVCRANQGMCICLNTFHYSFIVFLSPY